MNTPTDMRLDRSFFSRDVLDAAPELVGKVIVRHMPDGTEKRLSITETEAYRGSTDTACHARFGRTKRTESMYRAGGTVYVYLCYGIHWLLNIVTGPEDTPQAVLIRGVEGFEGPGKLTRELGITGAHNMADVCTSQELYIEDAPDVPVTALTRVGIAYASEEDQARLWRFKRG